MQEDPEGINSSNTGDGKGYTECGVYEDMSDYYDRRFLLRLEKEINNMKPGENIVSNVKPPDPLWYCETRRSK